MFSNMNNFSALHDENNWAGHVYPIKKSTNMHFL